jgi:dipeptidyl aminopeptidase/acylaminoacyl peptidase
MSGVDAVVERGVADPERLFVMGWSYGGYMTSCVVSRTDRFRAASMGAGLPNLVSMVHTTDIPGYLVAHQGGRELWEDYEAYMRSSPIFGLEAIVTPTQILHGERDLRVPFTQGQEFYVALKRKGVPTEMAVYPRTPHGPREPRLLMDVTPRILAWFERFLPGESGASSADH